MAKVKIEFDIDNASFYYEEDIINLPSIKSVIETVASNIYDSTTDGFIRNEYGNTIGTYCVE